MEIQKAESKSKLRSNWYDCRKQEKIIERLRYHFERSVFCVIFWFFHKRVTFLSKNKANFYSIFPTFAETLQQVCRSCERTWVFFWAQQVAPTTVSTQPNMKWIKTAPQMSIILHHCIRTHVRRCWLCIVIYTYMLFYVILPNSSKFLRGLYK